MTFPVDYLTTRYSWEIALNVGLDVSFDNMQDWKGIREKAGEVNSTEVYITNDGLLINIVLNRHVVCRHLLQVSVTIHV
jgi:hypothetical protein